VVNDLQSKLEVANAELISEKRKVILTYNFYTFHFLQRVLSFYQLFDFQAQVLAAENEKLQYRIIHLLRSLKNADLKLEQVSISGFPFNSQNIF